MVCSEQQGARTTAPLRIASRSSYVWSHATANRRWAQFNYYIHDIVIIVVRAQFNDYNVIAVVGNPPNAHVLESRTWLLVQVDNLPRHDNGVNPISIHLK